MCTRRGVFTCAGRNGMIGLRALTPFGLGPEIARFGNK